MKQIQAITKAMKCIVLVQHDDGTIDLHSTNFHSTPDTAFFVNYLSPVYIVLKNLDQLNKFIANVKDRY